MAQIFCVANQKGGVGKTTTAVNLAASLAAQNQRVLLVDLDPQGNATMGSGVDKQAIQQTVYQVLIGEVPVADAIVTVEETGYDVLPANRELAGAEVDLVGVERRERRLREALQPVGDRYDFILIDCPPALSLLTLNGLVSAHGVIIPMQCEYFALEGLSDLVNTIKQVHANLNRDLKIIGLLRVMFDPRITLQQQVSEQLKQHFGDKVFNTVIPRNVRLAEAPSYGLPGTLFDPSARGAQAYLAFGEEMLQRTPTGKIVAAPPTSSTSLAESSASRGDGKARTSREVKSTKSGKVAARKSEDLPAGNTVGKTSADAASASAGAVNVSTNAAGAQ